MFRCVGLIECPNVMNRQNVSPYPRHLKQQQVLKTSSLSVAPTSTLLNWSYHKGESIPIYADIENCSSRLVVPEAMIYQIQTYMANGKTKIVKQLIASVRGNIVPSDCSDRWNGKSLKIPPVSPSILNSYILRVEYLLAVIVQIPGAKNLKVKLPLVIGTIPYGGLGTRCFGMSNFSSMDMSFLTLALPNVAEAPPSYADVVSREEFEDHRTSTHQSQLDWMLDFPALA